MGYVITYRFTDNEMVREDESLFLNYKELVVKIFAS
jgi:hypothetical protein